MRRRGTMALTLIWILVHQSWATDNLRTVSKKLMTGIGRTNTTIAVLNFPYSRNRSSTGSHLVSERLVTYMVQDGARVVERRLLRKILEERKLWQTGLVDVSTLKSVGTILGVDAIVTGTLTDLSDLSTEVLARVIKIETGEILAAASAIVDRIWLDTPKLPRVAQPRSAVPVALPPLERNETREPAPSLNSNTLSLGPRRRNRREHYFPAPVPFVLPTATKTALGGNNK